MSSPRHAWRKERFRALYEAHYDPLWRYCLRRAADAGQAEDALSETFMVAWRRLDIVPTGDDVRPWLFAVARNQLRNGWRKNKRGAELRARLTAVAATTATPTATTDPAEAAVQHVAAPAATDAIFAALAQLREKDQEILRLAVWEELPHAEIATILGCSENAVAIRIHRARDRFAKKLGHTSGGKS